MHLIVNGKTEKFDDDLSLIDLLTQKGVARPETVAVELNGDIIKQNQIAATKLRSEDKIEIIYFMGGGEAAGRKSVPENPKPDGLIS